ncbi:MAG: FeoB-associated Cys-rich membrane protein [Prevotellaceae bacterium]|jgi:hypothetical protein|nr:FeoB-associated Cys-rich membrane protein [Prevotellaceae bacterium]
MQNIVVIIILGLVALYFGYRAVRLFSKKKDENACNCGCEGCELKDACNKKV